MKENELLLEEEYIKYSIDKYCKGFEEALADNAFDKTPVANSLFKVSLLSYIEKIKKYLEDYGQGKAVQITEAAKILNNFRENLGIVAFIAEKTILNASFAKDMSIQSLQYQLGQRIEDEYKMLQCKKENPDYYKSIIVDLKNRGANPTRSKIIVNYVFKKKLNFYTDSWAKEEKYRLGMVLLTLFIESTNLVEYYDYFLGGKHLRKVIPTNQMALLVDNLNEKFEVMQVQFKPMICKPKEWTGVFEGGYLSEYMPRNKIIKNNSKDYLKMLAAHSMPKVYSAINHLQNTEWQINKKVLDVVQALWEIGEEIAELPNREDKAIPPYPYPEKTKDDKLTKAETEIVKNWKREAYIIHKTNVQKRSIRILVSQILRIAIEFKDYEKIYFPYQMDFRGRLYPIPVLLQPQGSDLAKGLLRFAKGKKIVGDNRAIHWLKVHGANVFGYDKESYEKRVEWVNERNEEIKAIAQNPLENRLWAEADKPFQFLAWCFEYNEFLQNPEMFETHIPIQLDGTCNGLQHYSALLRDEVGGAAVNLINSEKPSDIYSEVANKLIEKLKEIKNDNARNFCSSRCSDVRDNDSVSNNIARSYATHWLELGINRKLTKRPVMVLPYGGCEYSCREFIEDYLLENYSQNYLWEHFSIGKNPTDCIFKVTKWLSHYLWIAISETLIAAISGMDYIKRIAKLVGTKKDYIEWKTPVGLIVRQKYYQQKKKMIRTELYGSILKTTVNIDTENADNQKQINGICPNFIHSLDASCLMLYLNKCKEAGIDSFMTVHDCYGTYATDTDTSARLLREAFVEIYQQPILANFISDITKNLPELVEELPKQPDMGNLEIKDILRSNYFFN